MMSKACLAVGELAQQPYSPLQALPPVEVSPRVLIQSGYKPIRDSWSETVLLQMPHDQLLRGCEANLKHGCVM